MKKLAKNYKIQVKAKRNENKRMLLDMTYLVAGVSYADKNHLETAAK